jgi:uncharacterized membrane protein
VTKYLSRAERSVRRLLCWAIAAPVILAAFAAALAWVLLTAAVIGVVLVCVLLLAGLSLLAMDEDQREAVADMARKAKDRASTK